LIPAATCTSTLDAETAAHYKSYLDRLRPQMEKPLEPAALKPTGAEPRVWNVNASGPNGVLELGKGVIIHWGGAIRIKVPATEALERTLLRYDMYTRWYSPYIAQCRATPVSSNGKQLRVVTLLHDILEKPAPFLPDMHFTFEVESASAFRWTGPSASPTLLVTNNATKIRESDGGHPERADSRNSKNDLMAPDHGHGVLWRSDSQWRAIKSGDSVYAEYESVTLARSVDAIAMYSPCAILRLPGIRHKAITAMTERPQRLITRILRQTRVACEPG